MIKEYLQCIRIEAVRHANMLGNIIADLPFIKKKKTRAGKRQACLSPVNSCFSYGKL